MKKNHACLSKKTKMTCNRLIYKLLSYFSEPPVGIEPTTY